MATTYPFSLVAGPYATYDSPTTSISWAAARPHRHTRRQSNGLWNGSQHRKNQIMTNSANNISADINMNGQNLEGVGILK